MNILIIGAGFSGSVCARELAEAGHQICIIDRRDHIGGNAYDLKDQHGILIHQYGPHIFHTNSERIFNYLSKYTEWHSYEHRVRGVVNGKEYPFPINRDTLNQLYDLELNEQEAANFFDKVREPKDQIKTSEDVVLNSVGRDLYEKFFLNYTKKQWGLDPSQLKAGVAARIPTRTNTDDRYFTDTFQVMPLHGYTAMFKNLLNHPNIEVKLSIEFRDILNSKHEFDHIVYTGPIDAFYDFKFGHLPYRSLRFEHENLSDQEWYQSVGTINYPNDFDFTRITEFKHLTGQTSPSTSIVREYPTDNGDPYYPIPRDENEQLFKQYQTLANKEENVTFVGRLAEYRYYNMDQVVGAALNAVANILEQKS
ncbi:UDP-galactopyranose mutase [Acinetobacter bereziniae]|uniref:UDP-galactopyranose mutase n=1 Tax=Acinetobacter bereziniae TaxID=106648 RepID=UPI0022EADF90|nr:UDP-galactopyranose mutase [Acinetobacter bereziniae]MDA3439427.1 UDP-galactopyranose mutase [Acinetobacter bereziniae]